MTCPRVIVALGLVVALVALGGLPRAAAKEYALKPVNGGAFEELVVIPEIVAAVEFYSGERSDVRFLLKGGWYLWRPKQWIRSWCDLAAVLELMRPKK